MMKVDFGPIASATTPLASQHFNGSYRRILRLLNCATVRHLPPI